MTDDPKKPTPVSDIWNPNSLAMQSPLLSEDAYERESAMMKFGLDD